MTGVAVSVLGDSQARRMCGVWEQLDDGVEIDSRGTCGGWTTDDLKRSIRQLHNLNPICIVFVSVNDIFKHLPIDHTKSNFKTIIKLLRSKHKKILISTLPPTLYNDPKQQEQIRILNVFIQSLNNPPETTVINFHKLFHPFEQINKSYFQIKYNNGRPDLVHLSKQGYRALISLLSPHIPLRRRPALELPTTDPSTPDPATTQHDQ